MAIAIVTFQSNKGTKFISLDEEDFRYIETTQKHLKLSLAGGFMLMHLGMCFYSWNKFDKVIKVLYIAAGIFLLYKLIDTIIKPGIDTEEIGDPKK